MMKMAEFMKEIGVMVDGMDMDALVSVTVIPMKGNTNLINDTVVVSTSGMMEESTTDTFPKINDMDMVSLPGRMVLSMMETLSMDNVKDMANIPLPMVDNTKGLGRMDDMMDLELVLGKMEESIGVNGEMVWHTDMASKPIPMEIFVMKDNGKTMNRFVRTSTASSTGGRGRGRGRSIYLPKVVIGSFVSVRTFFVCMGAILQVPSVHLLVQ